MRRFTLSIFAVMLLIPLSAQTRQEALLEYQANRKKAMAEYQSNYRNACADFMRRRWEAFNAEAPVVMPERKEPTEPVVKERPEVKEPQPTTQPTKPEQPKPTIQPAQPKQPVVPEAKPIQKPEVPKVVAPQEVA